MNVRRAMRIGAFAAWGLALAPVAATFAQETTAPKLDAQGWWNKSQAVPVQGNPTGVDDPTGHGLTTAPTVPAPPTVPEDGLYVANDASGPTAIAAVRYLVGGAGGTLTLKVAEGTTLTGTEELAGCPVQGGFTPAQNGRWDSIPGYEPSTCTLTGTPTSDGTGFTFEVPSSFASSLGDVSIVIVPAVDSTTPFSLPFAKPTDDGFVATSAPTSSSSSGSFSSGSFSSGSSSFSAPSSSGSFAAPSSPAVSTPAAGGDQTAAAPVVPTDAAPVVALAKPSRTSQVIAVLLLVVVGGAMWWLSSKPQRMPRLLGSVGGSAAAPVEAVVAPSTRPRGVGRFARHRDAPATPI